MALADDPAYFISHLMARAGKRGDHACKAHPKGVRPWLLPLRRHERVYGSYAGRVHFTPDAVIYRTASREWRRIDWSSVMACGSRHGDSEGHSKLQLVDGSRLRFPLAVLGPPWGRPNQIFHGMLDRWSAVPALGPPLESIESFFARAPDAFALAANRHPHPSLEVMRAELEALRARSDVRDLLIALIEDGDEGPYADQILLVTSSDVTAFEDAARQLQADGLAPARPELVRKVKDVPEGCSVVEIVWD